MRATIFLTAVFVLATVVRSPAQCPTNPNGGPTLLEIDVAADGSATDLDVGTTANVHNIEIPAFEIPVCLGNCDASTDPDCTVEGVQPGEVAAAGSAPPMPLYLFGTDLCVSFGLPSPLPTTTGTANVQTGDLNIATTFQARTFLGTCPTCVAAACVGGAQNGSQCTIHRSVTANLVTYDVSADCQPAGSGLAGTVSFPVGLTTALATQATCPGQAPGDACSVGAAGACTLTPLTLPACTIPLDGTTQTCCSGDPTRSCFPAAGISRQGTPSAPTPLWPSTVYPKLTKSVLVSTTCAPASGTPAMDQAIGLPGPAAIEVVTFNDWFGVDTTTTSTSTTIPGGCTVSCDDDNVCTTDACVDASCTNVLSPGIPGVRCLIDRMRTRPLCDETVDAKLAAAIDKALGKADGFLAKADTLTGKKRAKQLKKAKKQISRIFRKTDKAKKKNKIADACHAAISGRTGTIHSALGAIL